eukprot:6192785-Heterocapsa_arctica.AAC.1
MADLADLIRCDKGDWVKPGTLPYDVFDERDILLRGMKIKRALTPREKEIREGKFKCECCVRFLDSRCRVEAKDCTCFHYSPDPR